jgi:hypothetical protein
VVGDFSIVGMGMGKSHSMGMYPLPSLGEETGPLKNARLFERRAPTSVILNRVKMKTDL